jgi:hypothetical protein
MSYDRIDHYFVADWNDQAVSGSPTQADYRRRALSVWPGLDRTRLQRARNDPLRIARLVSRVTSQPIETILVLLLGLG